MTMNSLDKDVRLAVEAAQDKQALDICVLNLRDSAAFADYFLFGLCLTFRVRSELCGVNKSIQTCGI